MTGFIVVLAPMVGAVVALVLTAVLVPRRRRQVAIDERTYPGLAALRAKTTWARAAGLICGLGAAWIVGHGSMPDLGGGRGEALSPLAFGIVLLAASTLGDLVAHRDARRSDGIRTAAAADTPRSLHSLIPRGLTVVVAVLLACIVALLGVGWTLGGPDDQGRPGRVLPYTTPDGLQSSWSSPWPGAFYAQPVLIGIALLLVTLAVALLVVTRRPADAADAEIARVDGIVRRREAETLVAGTGLSLAGLTVPVALIEGMQLLRLVHNGRLNGYEVSVWYQVGGWSALVVAIAALIIGTWCFVSLLLPGPAARPGRRSAVVTVGDA